MTDAPPKTILLVEDERLVALAESVTLERAGYRVVTTHTGESAVEAVRGHQPIDLVLMDIDLGPGIDGTEAAQAILRERTLPVVFLSSHTETAVVEKTEGITSFGYIVKNSGDTVLLASIKMAFRLFEAQQELNLERARIERANEALRASEGRFRSIVESSPVPIFIQTRKRFAYVNPAAIELFGASEESDLLGMSVFERFHPDYHDMIRERIFRLNQERASVRDVLEQRYLRLDGTEVWVETVAEPVEYEGEAGALVFARNITERHNAKTVLEHSEALLNETQRMARLGSWELDLKTGQLTWSEETFRLFGLNPQEAVASYDAFLSHVHPEDREAVDAAYRGSLEAGAEGYEIDHRIVRCGSNDVRRVREKCSHIRDDTGHIVRSIGFVQDLTP